MIILEVKREKDDNPFFWQTHSTSRFDCSSNVQDTIRVQDSHLLLPRSQLLLLERDTCVVTTVVTFRQVLATR